jgi:hypothetical protein
MPNAEQPLCFSQDRAADPQARWAAATQYIEGVRDALGKCVDAGIKSLVIAFNASGFPTTASCQGHLHWGIPAPWIDLRPPATQSGMARRRKLSALEEEMETIAHNAPNAAALDALYERRRLLAADVRRPTLVLARRLMTLLAASYRDRKVPYEQTIGLHLRLISLRMQCYGTVLQDIATPAEKAANLERYRAEMCTFAPFLTAWAHDRNLT